MKQTDKDENLKKVNEHNAFVDKVPGPARDSIHAKIGRQIMCLDQALNTIPYYGSEETKLVRSYLIAQIECLKWVQKKFEV